jgi:8-oxo-dGTP pyrophosphatase MutT (NUDIX family)
MTGLTSDNRERCRRYTLAACCATNCPSDSWPVNPERGARWRSFGNMTRLKKGRAKKRSSRPIQYGALPYREIKSGVQILLVTSRNTRRWIIPKGWPQSGTPPHRAAAREAFEEAGVVGKISEKMIGSYWYDKIFESGATVRCKVRVFPLRVTRQFKKWPEKPQRRAQWHSPAQASRRVREIYLRQIIRTFAKRRKVES